MASQTTTGKGALHPLTSGHEVQAANKTCVSFQLLSECTRLQNKSSAECNHMVSMSCATRGMPPYSQRLNIQQISQQKCKLTRLGQSKLIKSGLPQPTFHRNDLPQYSLKRNNVCPPPNVDLTMTKITFTTLIRRSNGMSLVDKTTVSLKEYKVTHSKYLQETL